MKAGETNRELRNPRSARFVLNLHIEASVIAHAFCPTLVGGLCHPGSLVAFYTCGESSRYQRARVGAIVWLAHHRRGLNNTRDVPHKHRRRYLENVGLAFGGPLRRREASPALRPRLCSPRARCGSACSDGRFLVRVQSRSAHLPHRADLPTASPTGMAMKAARSTIHASRSAATLKPWTCISAQDMNMSTTPHGGDAAPTSCPPGSNLQVW